TNSEITNASRVFIFDCPFSRRLHGLRGLVFYKLKLQSNTSIGTVEERPKLFTRDIVLHVARIPMIRYVEDCESRASLVLFSAKTDLECFHHEHVESHQLRKTPAFIAWSNKILCPVNNGKREPRVPVEDRSQHKIVRQRKVTPEQ